MRAILPLAVQQGDSMQNVTKIVSSVKFGLNGLSMAEIISLSQLELVRDGNLTGVK